MHANHCTASQVERANVARVDIRKGCENCLLSITTTTQSVIFVTCLGCAQNTQVLWERRKYSTASNLSLNQTHAAKRLSFIYSAVKETDEN